MSIGVEAERERRFPLASHGSTRARSSARRGCWNLDRRGSDDRGFRRFFCLGLKDLGGLVDLLFFEFLFVGAVEPIGDFCLLIVNRRSDRRQPGWMDGTRMLDDVLAKCVMILVTRGFGRFGRFEAHVVPAEILKAVAYLAKTLRSHGRASSTLAGEKTGREGSERLGFDCHLYPPY